MRLQHKGPAVTAGASATAARSSKVSGVTRGSTGAGSDLRKLR